MGRQISILKTLWRLSSALALFVLTAVLLSPGPSAAQSCAPVLGGLVSWWPGEGNANDAADGNDGTLQNGATFAAGKVGQAFSFDGANDHLLVPHAANVSFGPTAPMSIAAWVFRTGTGAVMHIAGKRDGCGSIDYQLAFDANGLGFGGAVTPTVPPLNQWMHVAGTFDGSTFRLYVDGELKATAAGTLGAANTAPLKIGASGTCSFLWAGLIDEVELYDRAVADAEVRASFEAGGAGRCKLDHFLCYKPKATKGSPKFERIPGVVLADQFATVTATVSKPVSFCTPADKNDEGIFDEDTHLEGYQIAPETKHVPRTHIAVDNQFGTIAVDTTALDRLLVPTAKSLSDPDVLPPDPDRHDVDHYTCYKVKITPGTAKFQPRLGVAVVDQFDQPKLYDIQKPTRLCAPASKDVNGDVTEVKNPDAHLLCYQVKPAKQQPKHIPVTGIHASNQFGTEHLETVKEEELCVPSVTTAGS